MFTFATARPRRRLGLTPMIDVVFLLLVFFMLAAQFGQDVALPLGPAGGGDYSGPPRLVTVRDQGVTLNGTPLTTEGLADALAPLMTNPDDIVVLRAEDTASVQDLSDVLSALRAAGFTALAVAE